MLKREDNEVLTRVGPGAAMGDMLREYWMPAARSASLVAGGAPVRVRLLGEDFVAFRGDNGQVGFLEEACPHRLASLALARNEDNALRCIFHAWKINADGKVLETPCEPAARRQTFAANIKLRRFAVREAGSMVWVYLGKNAANPPPFPEFEFTSLPDNHVFAWRAIVPYNYLQGIEAHIDASHVGVLHSGQINGGNAANRGLKLTTQDQAPEMQMHRTSYGIREAALRDQDNGMSYVRIREIVMPFFTFIATQPNHPGSARASIPVDDHHTAEWYISYDKKRPVTEADVKMLIAGTSGDPDNFASTLETAETNWGQDRAAMKNHWSGFPKSFVFEDFVVEASMGSIADRSKEHLGAADTIIVSTRRMLLDALRDFQQGKPIAWRDGIDYPRIRALAAMIPNEENWRTLDTTTFKEVQPIAAE